MTYKKRNIILFGLTLLFFFLSWSLAISETFMLSNQIDTYNHELEVIKNAPIQIAKIESELAQLEGESQVLYSGVLDFREGLLRELTSLCSEYNVKLLSFPEYLMQSQQDIELATSIVLLKGDFKNLIKLLYEFETNTSIGKISSADFYVKESRTTKKRDLYLTLYIQSINI